MADAVGHVVHHRIHAGQRAAAGDSRSHKVSEPPIDILAFGSGMGPHPDEVKMVAPAGSLIMFNSADLWHSGTFNYSPIPHLAVTTGLGPTCSDA